MSTYVFAIGGTGARVLRSLTMLLASGVECQTDNIIPIIIDLDAQNGDTNRSLNLLENYKSVRKELYGDDEVEDGKFFSTKVSSLGAVGNNGDQEINPNTFQLEFGGSSQTFAQYLEASTMSDKTQRLLKLLYNDNPEHDPNTELNLKLDEGFKGNPNLGSVIFTQLLNNKMFNYFAKTFNQGDNIFIISSIFGGTGSSGFPQLVKILKSDILENNYIKEAPIGAISVLPYFKVEPDPDSAIDSDLFVSKAKAALHHYSNTMNEVDSMYYIADRGGEKPYKNFEGGKEQQNDAHVVELLASTAFFHFLNHDQGGGKAYEYGIKKDADPITFDHFHEFTLDNFMEPLTRFKFLTKLFLDFIPENQKEPYVKNLDLHASKGKFDKNSLYNQLNTFLSDFRNWLTELKNNKRAFAPFNLEEDFNELIKGREIKTGWFDKGISQGYLNTTLGKKEDELEDDYPNTNRRFIELMESTVDQVMEEKVGSIAV